MSFSAGKCRGNSLRGELLYGMLAQGWCHNLGHQLTLLGMASSLEGDCFLGVCAIEQAGGGGGEARAENRERKEGVRFVNADQCISL